MIKNKKLILFVSFLLVLSIFVFAITSIQYYDGDGVDDASGIGLPANEDIYIDIHDYEGVNVEANGSIGGRNVYIPLNTKEEFESFYLNANPQYVTITHDDCEPFSCEDLEDLAEVNQGANCGLLNNGCGGWLNCGDLQCGDGEVCTSIDPVTSSQSCLNGNLNTCFAYLYHIEEIRGICYPDNGCLPVVDGPDITSERGRQYCFYVGTGYEDNTCRPGGGLTETGVYQVYDVDGVCKYSDTLTNLLADCDGISTVDDGNLEGVIFNANVYYPITLDSQSTGRQYYTVFTMDPNAFFTTPCYSTPEEIPGIGDEDYKEPGEPPEDDGFECYNCHDHCVQRAYTLCEDDTWSVGHDEVYDSCCEDSSQLECSELGYICPDPL